MLMEDLVQMPSIFVSAFEVVMHTNPRFIKAVGEFNDLGTANIKCREFAIEMIKAKDRLKQQETRTETNGIVNNRVESQDIRNARMARFVKAGDKWGMDAGQYVFVAQNGNYASEAEAAQVIDLVS